MHMKKTLLSVMALAGLLTGLQAQKTIRSTTKPYSVSGKTAQVYVTADTAGYRLTATGKAAFKELPQPLETQLCVFVDPDRTFQTILGFGGALTDAAAETFYKLPKNKQAELIQAYYSKDKGIGYTLGRTNINSCDFSSDTYTYTKEGDSNLASFDIAHDRKYKLPLIKAAMAAAGGKLQLFASPWSPPAWMKNNNDMLHGGKLKQEYRHAWATYFTRFIKAYEKEGVPVWGISVQNEPMATQIWESCIFTAEEERDFVKQHLGPVMQQAGLGNKKIIAWDHNRDLMYQRAATYLSDPEAARYIWGIGYHWYENWSGGLNMFDNVKRVHEAFPDKHLLFTEGCSESFNPQNYNRWALGERYGLNMINDFNNGTEGFTDWNILLDETGGPNHVGNFCFAPVHGDTRSGELIYTNAYYYIGHFSKFVTPGAKRIAAAPSRSQLLSTAFRNPDGTIAVVIMNTTDKRLPYYLWVKGKAVETVALPHAIQTIVF
jgi:glucosylceramidase